MIITVDFNFYLRLIQVLVGAVTIFYGRRLYWLWLGFSAFFLGEHIISIALFRDTDLLRFSAAIAAGVAFALLAIRLHRHALATGGFLSAGMLGITVTGLFMPVAPTWLAASVLAGAGIAGAFFVWRRSDLATILLSAVSGTLTISAIVKSFVGANAAVEAVAFVILAGLGIWVQVRQWQRPRWTPRARRGAFMSLLMLLAAAGCVAPAPGDVPQPVSTASARQRPELQLTAADRILVLAPHPDDETLSSGGLIQQALALGLPVRVVWLTNGDSNEWSFVWYRGVVSLDPGTVLEGGLTRHQEGLNAITQLGLKPADGVFLGYPDFGTLEILLNHWGDRQAFRAMLTQRNAVPYLHALRPGAPYRGESILADLETELRDFKPTKIFLSHPGDQNPDHQALYLFTRVALWDLADELNPELYAYLVHYGRFPDPRGLLEGAALEPPANFDAADRWRILTLSQAQVDRKLIALREHRTQFDVASRYLESFVRRNELFEAIPQDQDLVVNGDEIIYQAAGMRNTRSLANRLAQMEQLTQAERMQQLDIETQRIRREGDELVVSVAFLNPPQGDVKIVAEFLGDRGDKPFAEMPKLTVELSESGSRLLERGRVFHNPSVRVFANATSAEMRVPLAALGNPQRALVNVRVRAREVPLEVEPWQPLDLVATGED